MTAASVLVLVAFVAALGATLALAWRDVDRAAGRSRIQARIGQKATDGGGIVSWDLSGAFNHRCPWPRRRAAPGWKWTCPYCDREWTTEKGGVRGSSDTGARVVAVTMRYADDTERTFRVPR